MKERTAADIDEGRVLIPAWRGAGCREATVGLPRGSGEWRRERSPFLGLLHSWTHLLLLISMNNKTYNTTGGSDQVCVQLYILLQI